MSYDPNYWGTICELADEPHEPSKLSAWRPILAVAASALITLGVVAYFVA